jgi:DNA-binding CsgD family transcriptional regulator
MLLTFQDYAGERAVNEHDLIGMIRRLEEKLDRLIRQEAEAKIEPLDISILRGMTTKQHVALQLIIHGHPNKVIADALGISVNTAKVHVRTVAAKLDLHTRAQITKRMAPVLDTMDDKLYRKLSGGLPKDWGARGVYGADEGDEFAHLYT